MGLGGVSRESCSDAVRKTREVLSRIVDVENALVQPSILLLSTFMSTIILVAVTTLSASLAFLHWIIEQDLTKSLEVFVILVSVALVLCFGL